MKRKVYIENLQAGDILIADDGFTCMKPGPKEVKYFGGDYFIECDCGKHFLDGQIDYNDPKGPLIGFSYAEEN